MYSFSAAAKTAYKGGSKQGVTLTITPATGTAITVTEANIKDGTFVIDRMSALGGGVPFGTAYSNSLEFSLFDPNGTYAAFAWNGATITVSLYVDISGTRTLAGNGGKFFVKSHTAKLHTVTVSAQGVLTTMDSIASRAGDDGYDLYLTTILQNISNECFGNATTIDYSAVSSIASAVYMQSFTYPAGQDVTYRNLLAWCAAICGCTVIETGNGNGLKLVRSSGSYETINAAVRFSGDCDDDVAVTGVKAYAADGTLYSALTTGANPVYNLLLRGNGVFEQAYNQSNGTDYRQTLVNNLYTAINAFSMCPFTAECLPMPWLECGDGVYYYDPAGTAHTSVITHVKYRMNGKTTVECTVANAADREGNLSLPPAIERSSIGTEMLRTNALKSINFVDDSGVYSQRGTYFDLAEGFIKSKNFAVDKDGVAYFGGVINATAIPAPGSFEVTKDDVYGVEMHFANNYTSLDAQDDLVEAEASGNGFRIASAGAYTYGDWAYNIHLTAPTAAYTGTGVKVVYLDSAPATKYAGWIYLIKNDGIYYGTNKIASI